MADDDRKVTLAVRPTAGTALDPFHLDGLTRDLAGTADGVLLVAPKHMGARRAAPASVVNGLPVGLVFADHSEELTSWGSALALQGDGAAVWAVLAMRTSGYLRCGRRLCGELRQQTGSAFPPVKSWLADEVTPWELSDRLALGPRLVIYLGHATSVGFSGYLGLDWDSIRATRMRAPCGAVVCLACNALHGGGGYPPFGRRWVQEGRAGAFWGSVKPTESAGNAALASLLAATLRGRKAGESVEDSSIHVPRTVGEMLVSLAEFVAESGQLASKTFGTYRLIGDPLQAIHASGHTDGCTHSASRN